MITVDELAKLIGGQVIGDGSVRVSGMSHPVYAGEEDLTCVLDDKGLELARKSKASCVMTTVDTRDYPKTVLKVGDIKVAMTMLYNALVEMAPPRKGSVHPTAIVPETARIGDNVTIEAYTVLGENVSVGANTLIRAGVNIGGNTAIGGSTVIHPNVVIYDNVNIGNSVIIHSGAVIGADGFGFVNEKGKVFKVPQMGSVVLGDDVEIGANTCIDRGTLDNTVIGSGTKIDNLVQIAHNVRLGRYVIIAAQTGIAGSSSVGDGTLMGGNVGIADHLRIGSGVKIGAKTGVTGHVKDGETVFGYPHMEVRKFKKLYAVQMFLLRYFDKLRVFVREL